MALIVEPDGKQTFVALPAASASERRKALTTLFEEDQASPCGMGIRAGSLAERLKFVQVAYGSVGKPGIENKFSLRFGAVNLYFGRVAFLRKDEKI